MTEEEERIFEDANFGYMNDSEDRDSQKNDNSCVVHTNSYRNTILFLLFIICLFGIAFN